MAGAAKSSAEAEVLGRSQGGFGTNIHAITDALGNPLNFVLTGGQASDMGRAETLLGLTPEGAEAFIGDKGYDSDALVQAIEARDMAAVIPPRSHRIALRKVDWFIYRVRHPIESSSTNQVLPQEFLTLRKDLPQLHGHILRLVSDRRN